MIKKALLLTFVLLLGFSYVYADNLNWAFGHKPTVKELFENFAKDLIFEGELTDVDKASFSRLLFDYLKAVPVKDSGKGKIFVAKWINRLCIFTNTYHDCVIEKGGKEEFDMEFKNNIVDVIFKIQLDAAYRFVKDLAKDDDLLIDKNLREEIVSQNDKPIYERYYKSVKR